MPTWAVVINDLGTYEGFDLGMLNTQRVEHPSFPEDMFLALDMARALNLRSCVLSGMRHDTPYGNDELVDVSVKGFMADGDFTGSMKRVIESGPQPAEADPPDAVTAANYMEHLRNVPDD